MAVDSAIPEQNGDRGVGVAGAVELADEGYPGVRVDIELVGPNGIEQSVPFFISVPVLGELLALGHGQIDGFLEWAMGNFGMAWSGLGWAVHKFLPRINAKLTSEGGTPVPAIERGEDAVVKIVHHLVDDLPAQMRGLHLRVLVDETGVVIGFGRVGPEIPTVEATGDDHGTRGEIP